jgi:hypothetical protein
VGANRRVLAAARREPFRTALFQGAHLAGGRGAPWGRSVPRVAGLASEARGAGRTAAPAVAHMAALAAACMEPAGRDRAAPRLAGRTEGE